MQDFVFYGHSMGAIIAYCTAIKLRALGATQPKQLFFSGRKGPVLNTGKGNRHKLPSKEFKLELENLGGCPKEVLQNHELMEIFEPILRADFKAVETYQYASTEPLHQKITLFHGIQDHFTKEDVMTWQQESTQPLEYFEFDGGHFFIQKECEAISKTIETQLHNLGKHSTF
jgi:surfactin synthase thioesterase subunit